MIEAKIDTAALQQKFAVLALKMADRRPVNRKVSVQLQAWVFRNFKQEGGLTEGGAWAPLAPSTVAAKAKSGYAMILQNTGALRQSFAPFYDNNMAGVGAQQLLMSDAKSKRRRPFDLARIHHEGAPKAHIPARPMLPTKRQGLEIGVRIYALHVAALARSMS